MHFNRPAVRPAPRYRGGGGGYRGSGASSPSQNEFYRFSSEARQAPASTDSCFVFPWNTEKDCYEVFNNFDKHKSEGRIDELIINELFQDIHTIRLWSPKVADPMVCFAIALFLISIPLFFVYLFSGLFTSYYNYEIKQDGDKRYIDKIAATGRFIEIPMVAVMIVGIGMVIGFIMMSLASKREYCRIRRRAFVLKKIVEKHQRTTFEGSGCTVTSSELGAYIKIVMNRKVPVPPNPVPAVVQPAPVVPLPPQAAGLSAGVGMNTTGQVPFETIEIKSPPNQPEKTEVSRTPLITEHPEDVRLQIPEEQPL